MSLKIAILLLTGINSVFGQEFLFCMYGHFNETYTCSINIFNPFGKMDFPQVNGTHWPQLGDDDVKAVMTGYTASSENIPPIICNQFKNIETLSYRDMGLGIILNEAFAGCKNVTSIDLSSNKIVHVDENSFDENEKLEKLYFWSNELTNLPENLFQKRPNLVHLDLEKNKITDLPAGIFNEQENLKELRLNVNQISNLRPEWFENLKSLEMLALGSNKMEEIPSNTFRSLINLQQIWMDSNNLTVIHSGSFGFLPNLNIINVMSNQIIAIDEKILNVTGITILIMNGNICADRYIFDNSTGRPIMREIFRPCFDKYEELFPKCPVGDLHDRVCKLEEDNWELLLRTKTLSREKEELEKKFEQQVEAFKAAIENLQNQINELQTPETTTTLSTTVGDISTTSTVLTTTEDPNATSLTVQPTSTTPENTSTTVEDYPIP